MRFLPALFLLLPFLSSGQNLVPNSGFEIYYECPTQIGQLSRAKHWFSANSGTPEYFNSDCKSEWDQAYLGEGYAGLIVYGEYLKVVEYLGVELTDTLQAGVEYELSFYVKAEESPIYVDRIEMSLQLEDPSISYWAPIQLEPHLKNSKNIIDPSKEWVQVRGTYRAQGGERYAIIGNFHPDIQVSKISDPEVPRGRGWYSYYLIDQVSVAKVGWEEELSREDSLPRQKAKFRPIYFEFDSYDLSPSEQAYLKRFSQFVQDDLLNSVELKLIGHTDERGSDDYNLRLSEQRVQSVFEFLSSTGIAPERLKIEFKGEHEPANDEKTDEGFAKNRRVTISILEN